MMLLGALLTWRRQLAPAAARPHVGKCDDPLTDSHHRDRKIAHVVALKAAEREALLAHVLGGQPFRRDLAKRVQDAGYILDWHDLEAAAIAAQAPKR
jgi:hypothetical protein